MRLKRNPLKLCLWLAWPAAFGQTLLIRDVRVFDGKIAEVGGAGLRAPGAETVEGRGRTLLPGLFDAHLHVPPKPEAALHQLATLGITTVLDMFGGGEKMIAKKRIVAEDPPDMADMRASGVGATAPGSMLATMSGRKLLDIAGPEQAPAWVDARIAEGSDYIKVVYDDRVGGPLDRKTLDAVIQAAHSHGKLVVVHAMEERKAREAIADGADGLVHLFTGDSVGADFGKLAAEHHVFVIPTLITLYGFCGKPQGGALLADPRLEKYIPADQRQDSVRPANADLEHLCGALNGTMRQLMQAHVPILAGTDSGLATGRLLGIVAYGATLQVELKLLADEGMTPVQVLIAATSAPARAFRFPDRGWIRPGMRADLVLVEGDPTQDIVATRNIVAVWKKGVRIER